MRLVSLFAYFQCLSFSRLDAKRLFHVFMHVFFVYPCLLNKSHPLLLFETKFTSLNAFLTINMKQGKRSLPTLTMEGLDYLHVMMMAVAVVVVEEVGGHLAVSSFSGFLHF